MRSTKHVTRIPALRAAAAVFVSGHWLGSASPFRPEAPTTAGPAH